MLFWQGGSPLSTLSTHLQQERVLLLQKRRRQGWESPDLLDCTASYARHPSPLVFTPECNGRLFIFSLWLCCVAA